ncbi:hypothetical protein [Thalassotalea profundi]|uniref:Uncharacterized protein n=1 Tax=Thalassotalea profundi TaxID=2036687 RepID=A0ABQ3ITB9_9GAMM|nr:hypothetical protein [Thalassotalea profundi]GHE93471.1 hypothetical protein GCM10011501_23570 [Thalassotalea profundi]
MRRNNAIARKFISDNIKINASVSSYPLRKVKSAAPILSSNMHINVDKGLTAGIEKAESNTLNNILL